MVRAWTQRSRFQSCQVADCPGLSCSRKPRGGSVRRAALRQAGGIVYDGLVHIDGALWIQRTSVANPCVLTS